MFVAVQRPAEDDEGAPLGLANLSLLWLAQSVQPRRDYRLESKTLNHLGSWERINCYAKFLRSSNITDSRDRKSVV